MVIEPERVKEIFLALKLHFNSNYNYLKYQGKTRSAPIRANEVWHINKIRNKLRTEEYVFTFFLYNMMNDFWKTGNFGSYIGAYANSESVTVWANWRTWLERPYDNILRDLEKLSGHSLRQLIDPADSHPIIIKRAMGREIHLNTIALLYRDLKLKNYWLNNADPVLENFVSTIDKYQCFLEVEQGLIKKVLDETLKPVYK